MHFGAVLGNSWDTRLNKAGWNYVIILVGIIVYIGFVTATVNQTILLWRDV
jgi:hypothetical protein